MEQDAINAICGDRPENFVVPDIGNDPNFVFESDPTFDVRILYDIEGNVINVNSWLECYWYVKGGWSNSLYNAINYEQNLFFVLLIIVIGFFIYKSKKIRIKKN